MFRFFLIFNYNYFKNEYLFDDNLYVCFSDYLRKIKTTALEGQQTLIMTQARNMAKAHWCNMTGGYHSYHLATVDFIIILTLFEKSGDMLIVTFK